MTKQELFALMKGTVIVSCQATPGEPLYLRDGTVMPLMARAAKLAGARMIRTSSARDIVAIKEETGLPVIGLIKREYPGYTGRITMTMREVDECMAAMADIVSIDCTACERGDGRTPAEFLAAVKEKYPNIIVMADCATLAEGKAAYEAGADLVGTTMNGYTPATLGQGDEPNFDLAQALAQALPCPVIAEGRIHTPEQVKEMLRRGAWAVVVGGAITRPLEIATRFIRAAEEEAKNMILALDIGGTTAKMALADRSGRLYARCEAATCLDGYATPVLDTVVRTAADFLRGEGAAIEGVGISATGQIDTRTGTVVGTNGKIPNYEGAELTRTLESAFGVPARALNDANAAALGECFAGRAKGCADMVMVTLGTGVGGGIVLNGRIYGGARGIAGEIGHFTLYQDGALCACGKRGCYESYASTTALIGKARAATGEKDLNGRIIFDRAQKGDGVLRNVIDAWLDDVAAGLTGLVHIFNPEMLVVGGGVSAQEDLLIAPLRTRVLAGVMPRFAEGLSLQSAALGNDAGLVGAVAFWLEQYA